MNAPTLLVGLGGAGSKIIGRVANLVGSGKANNISCVVFDTDINELREIKKKYPFVYTIQTSTKQTVGEYLNKDTHARDTWFPVNEILNAKTLTEGAGQVRSISRLAFETLIRSGKLEPLHNAIQDLYKVEENKDEQALRVIIVGSLAGGTGSGLILPVSAYIHQHLKTKFRQDANITRGFFLLPEVFYGVIKGQAERNNLKANAYAALRELDAFLMKADNKLPSQYRESVRMQFPKVASDGYEEYDVRLFDHCFLFDAQNANGEKLNSHEQYLDHAANCIYAQSIGPMNKRSNSSEDNTIRSIAHQEGRNRYAGAGASILLYPFEDVKKYIALQWAKQCVSTQWLVYDKEYVRLQEENKRREEDGIAVSIPDPDVHYVKSVREKAENKDPFSRAIVRACTTFKSDGVTKQSDRWVEYVAALKKKVEKDAKSEQRELDAKFKNIQNLFGSVTTSNDWKDYVGLYEQLDSYRLQVTHYMEETAAIAAYSLFRSSREFRTTKPEAFELEYYLTDSENNFIHPNAVRYFLNQAYDLMQKELAMAKNTLDKKMKALDEAGEDIFDDGTTEKKEKPQDALNRKKDWLSAVTNRPSSEQAESLVKIGRFRDDITDFRKEYLMVEVLTAGCQYIKDIVEAFGMFYSTFEGKVAALDKQIGDISKRYVEPKGSTMRYVCADTECLEGIYKKKPFIGSTIKIDPQLAKNIYYSVLDYSLLSEKPANNRYFSDLFDNDILGYFETYVMQKYGDDIDMDIIRALEKEAEIKHPEYNDEENADQLIMRYVENVIDNVRALSCPFIERPMSVGGDAPIDACTFNLTMNTDAKLHDPKKHDLISRKLLDFGGVPDDDVPKNQIMFYQSFYSLRANDLSKFAPPQKALTYRRSAGEYFTAYYDMIAGIHPDTNVSREINPHIDRWWHVISKLPDLDEDNQLLQERRIHEAFFWGVLCKYIDRFEDTPRRFVYKLDKEELGMESDVLVVSNGTPCDKLYEVLDAITIYPELVNKILDRVNVKAQDDLNKNRELSKGILMRNLDSLTFSDPGLYDGNAEKAATSIFSLPLMMKKSSTPDLYYEDSVIRILKASIGAIRDYLLLFYSERELPEAMSVVLKEQFERYLADMDYESKGRPSLYRETLFVSTCSVIAKAFEELDMEDEARDVKDKARELRK